MTLTADTQKKLDQAFADKAAADQADTNDKAAEAALEAAMKLKDQADADARDAHVTATSSAHDFITAVATELGFRLPTSAPAPVPTPTPSPNQ